MRRIVEATPVKVINGLGYELFKSLCKIFFLKKVKFCRKFLFEYNLAFK